MKCSNCGKNNTNFVYTEIINGVKKEIRLCNECAERLGFLDMSLNMPSLDFSNFFEDFLNEYDNISLMPSIFTESTSSLKCKKCGTTYDDFLQDGRFGCSNCYNVFEHKIEPLLKQLHGDTRYLGKKSKNFKKGNMVDKIESININSELDDLKEKLKNAIKVENYEKAAEIRDKIKKLEDEDKNKGDK